MYLKFGFVPYDLSTQTTGDELIIVGGVELAADDDVRMLIGQGVERVQLLGFLRHAETQLLNLVVEAEETNAVAVRRADDPSVRREAGLLDETLADAELVDVVRQSGHVLYDFVLVAGSPVVETRVRISPYETAVHHAHVRAFVVRPAERIPVR